MYIRGRPRQLAIQRTLSMDTHPSIMDTHPSLVDTHPSFVSVQEHDFLEQDDPIRGQKFACVSFVSPEDALADKDAFVFRRFMGTVAADVGVLLDNLDAKFGPLDPDLSATLRMVRERHAYMWADRDMQDELTAFKTLQGSKLDQEFLEQHRFRTCVRGLKIRGVYDSIESASARAKAIKKLDADFNVYICEVGCWCPWSPNPEDIADSQYAETQLNTLVKAYRESHESKDEVYEARKQDMMSNINDERDAWLKRRQEQLGEPDATVPVPDADAVTVPVPDADADPAVTVPVPDADADADATVPVPDSDTTAVSPTN
jgi:hypothetical protein